MDYEEKYEMALETVQEILNSGSDSIKMSRLGLILQSVFPELKESDGERIREEIIDYLHLVGKGDGDYAQPMIDRWIAWLEKQGEQKPITDENLAEHIKAEFESFRNLLKKKGIDYQPEQVYWDTFARLFVSSARKYVEQKSEPKDHITPNEKFFQWIYDRLLYVHGENPDVDFMRSLKDRIREMGQEQKPVNQPKFKDGDWITNGEYTWYVEGSHSGFYDIVSSEGCKTDDTISHVDEHFRLWTIQDAKDCDVLVCIGKHGQEIGIIKEYVGKYGGCDKCFETYCFVDWDGIFRTGEYMGSKEIHPATKEQRDLLFAKMKEAGYDIFQSWDDEKLELRKVDVRENLTLDGDLMQADCMMVEQKPAELTSLATLLSNYLKNDFEYFATEKWDEKKWNEVMNIQASELLRIAKNELEKEQTAEWSEEDEHRIKDSIYFLETAKKHYACTEELDACINWLKSLRPQKNFN